MIFHYYSKYFIEDVSDKKSQWSGIRLPLIDYVNKKVSKLYYTTPKILVNQTFSYGFFNYYFLNCHGFLFNLVN